MMIMTDYQENLYYIPIVIQRGRLLRNSVHTKIKNQTLSLFA